MRRHVTRAHWILPVARTPIETAIGIETLIVIRTGEVRVLRLLTLAPMPIEEHPAVIDREQLPPQLVMVDLVAPGMVEGLADRPSVTAKVTAASYPVSETFYFVLVA